MEYPKGVVSRTYTYTHAHTHTHTCTHTHHIHVHTHTHHILVHTHIHTHTHHIHTHHIHVHTHACTHTYMYTHIHVHTPHTCTHTCTPHTHHIHVHTIYMYTHMHTTYTPHTCTPHTHHIHVHTCTQAPHTCTHTYTPHTCTHTLTCCALHSLQLSSQPAEITYYYVKENIDPQTTPGLRLVAGQSVELLDSSDARWWLVRNRDTMEEGMVVPSCLGRFPPSKLDGTSSADDLISPGDKKAPSASFDSYEPPEDVHRTPEGVLSEISSPAKAPTPCSASEMSLKRTTPIPDLSITTPSALARHAAQGVFGFTQPRPLWKSRRSMSYPDLCDGQAEELVSLEGKERASTHSLPGSMAALTPLLGQADMVMTKGGSCFSTARPSGLQELVLDPSRVEVGIN